MNFQEWSNFWLRQYLLERGYSMDHSHSDNRDWLLRAFEGAITVKLLNGSSVAHVGTVASMGDTNDVRVIVVSQGMTFEAWDLERYGDCFLATSWKRLS